MTKLSKDLSLYGLTMVAIGSCIGSGIFLTPSQIASHLSSPGLIMLVWGLGGIIALTGALTFAELSSMYPKAGGIYVYLREAYGDLAGFLYGWAYFTVICSGSIAALAIAFSYYLSFIIPLGDLGKQVASVVAILVIGAINVFRVRIAAWFLNAFTGLKLIGIAAVIGVGLFLGSSATIEQSASAAGGSDEGILSAFGLALIGVLWSYGGWQHASFLAGEAKNASRSVPRAMIFGALVVTFVYLLTNLSYMFLLPLPQLAASTAIAADAVEQVIPKGGLCVAALIALSTFGTALIYNLSAPRIYFAMAADGLFFRQLAYLHPKYRTPVNSVVSQSLWAIVLVLFWGTFENVIEYVTFTDWVFFALGACIVIKFRLTRQDQDRPYRTAGYPVSPLIFIIISSLFVVNMLIERPIQAGAGLVLMMMGLPIYFFFKRTGNGSRENLR